MEFLQMKNVQKLDLQKRKKYSLGIKRSLGKTTKCTRGILVNEKGQKVDIDGRLINDNGEFINDDGHRVDRDGHLLDEDGTYIAQVEYIKDNPKPTPKKKTTRSRKRTAKTDSTT